LFYAAFLDERVDSQANVFVHALERALLAIAVAHAAIVEAQHGEPGARERSRSEHELSMTARTILRPADDDHDPDALTWCRSRVYERDTAPASAFAYDCVFARLS